MPYWQTPEKYLALLILAMIISINLGTAYISVEANRIAGKFTDALIGLDWEQIKPLFIFSFVLGLGAMMLRWVNVLSQGYLALRWRTWMTLHYIRRWTGTSAYYQIERDGALSNIDQRIADDVNELVSASLNFFLSIISVIISTVTYTALLWSVSGVLRFSFMGSDWAIPGYMVYALYIEYVLQVALSHWLGKALIRLNMNQQNAEETSAFWAFSYVKMLNRLPSIKAEREKESALLSALPACVTTRCLCCCAVSKCRLARVCLAISFRPYRRCWLYRCY